MTKTIFATAAVCLAVACAETDGEPTGAAMLGLHADDDGCPGTWGCKAAPEEPPAAVAPPESDAVCGAGCCPCPGCCPWPVMDPQAYPDICKVFPDYPQC